MTEETTTPAEDVVVVEAVVADEKATRAPSGDQALMRSLEESSLVRRTGLPPATDVIQIEPRPFGGIRLTASRPPSGERAGFINTLPVPGAKAD